jgi:ribosomal protein S27AE
MPEDERKLRCPRCNSVMTKMQECHLLCGNCGMQLDCSDKGWLW